MKLKTLIVSVAVLAALSAIVFVARRPAPPASADPRIGKPLVEPAAIEKAARVQVSDAGKTVTLVRQPDGSWRNTSYYDLPADLARLSGFVNGLAEAKIDRLVTSRPDRLSRLDFKDSKIELSDAANKPLVSLTLGKSSESGTGRFIRFGEEPKAYLTSVNVWLDAEGRSWVDTQLLNVKPEDVAKLEIEFPAAAQGQDARATTVTLSRAKQADAWKADQTPAGQQVKADKVAAVLSTAGSIRFTDTNDPTDPNVAAAKANERTIKLTTFDGKTFTIAMGRKPESKKLKAPTPAADGKTGPASLGSISDLAKKDRKEGDKPAEDKPVGPEFETIPAGPAFVFISSSDTAAPVNAYMQKRAFQISEYLLTNLPQKPEELFEPAPAPATPAAEASGKKG